MGGALIAGVAHFEHIHGVDIWYGEVSIVLIVHMICHILWWVAMALVPIVSWAIERSKAGTSYGKMAGGFSQGGDNTAVFWGFLITSLLLVIGWFCAIAFLILSSHYGILDPSSLKHEYWWPLGIVIGLSILLVLGILYIVILGIMIYTSVSGFGMDVEKLKEEEEERE
jgi:hypothetical protein